MCLFMSTTISAIFDHADAADFALAELNRSGLSVQAYRAYSPQRREIPDAQSEEVFTRVTIDDSQAATAQAMLVSSGGRQVHPIVYTS